MEIMHYIKEMYSTCNYESVLDVACGSGQSTSMQIDIFKNVYGTDISDEQIVQAGKALENVIFSVGCAEALDFENESMDLVTIGLGLHWVDAERFFSEAKRVLKPGGVLVAYSQNVKDQALDNEEATKFLIEEVRGHP